MVKNTLAKLSLIFIAITLLVNTTIFASNWTGNNIVGNWETAIDIDGEVFITRVEVDKTNEIAIKLREFMEYLGYDVTWNGKNSSIELKSDENTIKIFIGDNKCEKNGEVINLIKPVYIDHDYSYLPQSFLLTVLDIDTVSFDWTEASNRVDSISLSSKAAANDGINAEIDIKDK